MGRRSRSRDRLAAPASEYGDAERGVLVLRGALSPKTRAEFAAVHSGEALAPGAAREDAHHRAAEFLFERLAVSWTIAGAAALTRQKELLARYRMASQAEREFVRDSLRAHCAEHFPDVAVP